MHTIKTMSKRAKLVVAAILAAAVALTAIAFNTTANAKSSSTVSTKSLTAKAKLASGAEAQTSKSGDAISKQETVYVKADATGTRTATYVSDWLQNAGNETTLTDVSNLSNIKNVKGHEKFTKNGNTLTWKTKGKDIYYRGETDKPLPVNVQINYELNGESIAPKDLAGKSGDVKITFTYNNESETNGITTPFTCATALDLPTSRFSNVKVTNGAVISDGNNNIVVGIGFPGLKQNLGLENVDQIKIPESFTVEATVKNFKMGETLTSVSTDVLNRAGLKDIKSFKDLDNAINQLENASGQLVAGSLAARNGSAQLQTGAASLNTGMGSLQSGLNAYTAGVASAADGSIDLNNGINQLYNQVPKLTNGISQLYQGSQELTNSFGTQEQPGAVLQGANNLVSGTNQVSLGVTAIKNNLTEFNNTLKSVDTTKIATLLKNYQNNLSDEGKAGVYLENYANSLDDTDSNKQNIKDIADKLKNNAVTGKTDLYNAQNTIAILNKLPDYQKQLQYLLTVDPNDPKSGQLIQLEKGAQQTAAGAVQLRGNSEKEKGLYQAAYGINKLNEGLKELDSKNGDLTKGSDDLAKGSKKLSEGLNTLNANSAALNSGAAQLASGSSQLYTGTVSLTDGLNTLYFGMNQFKKTGIDKIANVYNNNFKNLANKLNAIKKASADYNNFSGISSNMGGSVNFVIETGSVSK
ncbi:hypothetical protein [Pseudoramibacter porci]|uniref:YhgE/Pip domain-containing protein n=1 Tax=Pseudoramibacter porci TaxID=2606631 RepID=A0A7X2NEW7_9FIRM|nr:hypothetical protein [Pseudoramibacter porci]MSS19245.1 hypothetical protein [Pseudoramibacter porci]